jgi:Mrp family chromosome partitioning ATPase
MTIQDALERSKQLRKARQQEQANNPVPSVSWTPAESRAEPRSQAPATRPVSPPVHFEPLATVQVSKEACELNRILLSSEQQREFPRADAAYRLIRSKMRQRMQRGGWSTIAVSSPRQNDGKTVTALNLALSVARENQRPVYVLDLDMRNPSVCRYLGLEDYRSIAEFFAGDAGPADVLYQTSVPCLIVAGARQSLEGASELLAGPKLETLLGHIRARSPDAIVVMDLPPVNVTDEALVVAPRADTLLVVVSEGSTQREDLSRTLSALSDFPVAGVVVNRSSEHYADYYGQPAA